MVTINAHKTAIRRSAESKPMKRLVAAGVVSKSGRTLDFGCGWGADVEWLQRQRIDAVGWDPHEDFGRSRRPTGKFAVVTAIYLVNVLPSVAERVAALTHAWSFVERGGCLVVVSRSKAEIVAEVRNKTWPAHSDGHLSSVTKGTFQKGHDRADLERLLGGLPGATIADPAFTDSGFAHATATRSR
jgi:DNA phosphorothioation-associated putative methyltransferase